MKLILILILFNLIGFTSCFNSTGKLARKDSNAIKGIKLFSNIPLGSQNGISFSLDDSCKLFFNKDFILMEDYTTFSKSIMGLNKTQDTVIPIETTTEIKQQYIGYKKNSKYGWLFKPENMEEGKRVEMDSVFKHNNIYFGSFDKMYHQSVNDKNEIKVNVLKDEKGNTVEKYISKVKVDASYPDTSYYYFSPKEVMKGINFSFSEDLDKARSMKLVMYKALYVGDPTSPDERKEKDREFIIGLHKIPVENQIKIEGLFQKVEALYSKKENKNL